MRESTSLPSCAPLENQNHCHHISILGRVTKALDVSPSGLSPRGFEPRRMQLFVCVGARVSCRAKNGNVTTRLHSSMDSEHAFGYPSSWPPDEKRPENPGVFSGAFFQNTRAFCKIKKKKTKQKQNKKIHCFFLQQKPLGWLIGTFCVDEL